MPAADAAEFSFVAIAISLVGGLALFLYGIEILSAALRAAAGDSMKNLLARLTNNRAAAVATGAVVTAVVQSSSVTTVLVIGFITAGVMSATQAVGVIMGANIGTTITAQIIAFPITKYAPLLIGAGFAASSLAQADRQRQVGLIAMSLGLVFLSIDLMSQATAPLREYPPFIDLMARVESPLLGVAVGALFTAVVQSSSAATGIIIMLAGQGLITLEGGIALALGSNIGTCVKAILATIGRPPEARQAAIIHLLFNVIGVLLWLGFIPQLSLLARAVSPAYPDLPALARLPLETPRQIANAHTIFNVANTLVLIWFAAPLGRLAARLAPAKKRAHYESQPEFLDEAYLATPSLALDRVLLEIKRLGDLTLGLMEAAPAAVLAGQRRELDRLAAIDDDVNALHAAIVQYARKLAKRSLTSGESQRLNELLSAAGYLENAGDLVSTNLVEQGRNRLSHRLHISPATRQAYRPLEQAVLATMRDAVAALVEHDAARAQRVTEAKAEINRLAEEVLAHLGQRLLTDDPDRVLLFQLETDIVGQWQRLYYYAKRIAKHLAAEAPAPEPVAA